MRWASSPPRPEGLLVLIPPGDLTTPIDHRLAGGRPGPDRHEDPHHEATRGVGPVTGTAGSEEPVGRGGCHPTASPRGPADAHTTSRLSTTPDHRRLAGRGSGPDRFEDPHREATRGVGPVTGTAGSEGRSGRGGRHRASSSRGPLGAHTIERPSPLLPLRSRPCWQRSGDRSSSGLPREHRDPNGNEDPHREATCGVGPVTGTAGSEEPVGEVGVTQLPQPEGLLVLIPPGDFQNSEPPPACR